MPVRQVSAHLLGADPSVIHSRCICQIINVPPGAVPIQRVRGTRSAFSGLSGASATRDDQESRGYSSASTFTEHLDTQRFNVYLSDNSDFSAASSSSMLDKDKVCFLPFESFICLKRLNYPIERKNPCFVITQSGFPTGLAASIPLMPRLNYIPNVMTAQP